MSNATEYADSMAAQIKANADAGTPFGVAEYDGQDDHEEGDELSAMDWLGDALDIQYVVTGNREYRSARVLVGFGGPNVWVNTQTGNLEVSWWGPTEYRSLPDSFIRGLDDALEELWSMGA